MRVGKNIRRISFFLICLLPFCVGYNQNTKDESTTQRGKSSEKTKITSHSSTEDTPASKTSSLSSTEQNNSSEEMKMIMKVVPNAYSSSVDKVNLTITNNTSFKIYTGLGYSIEHYNGSFWDKIPLDPAYFLICITVSPQESKDFIIHLYPEKYDYQPGRYRVCKTVSTTKRIDDPERRTYGLTAEFNIE
jgi:hypothetical protein